MKIKTDRVPEPIGCHIRYRYYAEVEMSMEELKFLKENDPQSYTKIIDAIKTVAETQE